MNRRRWGRVAVCVGGALLALTAHAATERKMDESSSIDGLQVVKVKGIDVAYARPGASLAAYSRVKIDPVEVAFRKDWDPARTGSSFKLSAEERESIRAGVAKIVHEEFVRELGRGGGYPVVDEAAPDVLRVKARIIDLYVNAPDTLSAGRSRTYVLSAGEMTLAAELFDSESGELIARVADRREARGTGRLQLSSSVVNAGEAATIASAWARILRKQLDQARSIGKP